ncbi:hypothetical protein [Amycolatopsis sp. WQ 127309]|uniref:hypothetical protein n=1 Tax=Amycolatopsis sp. WQ 127309 TaxID=2932773 RepID=UPI001FF0EB26|nr:hypothetical protein [Amycolatopsis sp. WQ 127309]UOZ03501.1 hypothetical protein MUY22_32185 [Amycolatopsis sp. WQ 127309]
MDLLAQWMSRRSQTGAASTEVQFNGLRFAFYGRTSTSRHQDRVPSQGWQRDMAEHLITGHGQIVAAHFDVGTSRRVPWRHRPQAARLLASVSAPEPAIDAIVVGECDRAFTGSQVGNLYTGAPATVSSCGCPNRRPGRSRQP